MKNIFLLIITICYINVSAQDLIKFVDSKSIIEESTTLRDDDKVDEAVKLLEQVNPNDSLYITSLFYRSYFLMNDEKLEDALKILDLALSLDIKNDKVDYITNKAVCLRLLDRNEDALKHINLALLEYPTNSNFMLNKGIILKNLNKHKESILAYQQAIILDPFNQDAHVGLGDYYYRQHLMGQALMCYTTALLVNPESEASFVLLQGINSRMEYNFEEEVEEEFEISTDDEHFEDINLILSNLVSLNKKYKTGNKLDLAIVRQLHIMLEQLDEFEGEEGFMSEKYVPLFNWVKEYNNFDLMVYTACYSIKYEKSKKMIVKHNEGIISFLKNFKKKWLYLTKSNPNFVDSKKNIVNFLYDGYVYGIIDENNDYKGKFYDESGRYISEGILDKSQKKQGDWIWYNIDGNISEKATFVDDKYEGEYEYYYDNQNISIKTSYISDKIEGLYSSYFKYGGLNYQYTMKDEKLEGPYNVYYKAGVTEKKYELNYIDNKIDDELIEYYSNGNKLRDVNIKNGEKVGKETNYYLDGKVREFDTYKNGVLSGEGKVFYLNEKIKEKGQYDDKGARTGTWSSFYFNGNIETEDDFVNGKLHGETNNYDVDGILFSSHSYKNGKLKSYKFLDKKGEVLAKGDKKKGKFKYKGFTPEGTILIEGLYSVKGGKIGEWKFYDHGVLKEKYNNKEGLLHGKYKAYYLDGILKIENSYKDDIGDGNYIYYYNNGNMKYQSYFVEGNEEGVYYNYYIDGAIEDELFMHKGQKHGIQKTYDPNGNIAFISVYEYGELISTKSFGHQGEENQIIVYENVYKEKKDIRYYENKNILSETEYSNGVAHGKYVKYDILGGVVQEGEYFNDNMNGDWKYYHANGKIRNELSYVLGNKNGLEKWYYESGKLKTETLYYYGTRTGVSKKFYENGEVEYILNNENGVLDGPREFYSSDGTLQLKRYYKNDVLIGYSFLDKSNKEVEMIPINNETGTIIGYYPNGKISRKMEYKYGELVGEYVAYYKSGEIENKIDFVNGEYNGLSYEYYENGNPRQVESHIYGIQDGEQKYYHENGKLKRTEIWKSNTKIGDEKYYNTDGKLIKVLSYFNGLVYAIEKF